MFRTLKNCIQGILIYKSLKSKFLFIWLFWHRIRFFLFRHLKLINGRYIQGEAYKVLQRDSTQTIYHIQKCFRQKFQCSRKLSYWTTLFFYRWRRWSYVKSSRSTRLFQMEPCIFFSITLLPILRGIQRPTTQGHSSHAKYENSRKIETYRNNIFQSIH